MEIPKVAGASAPLTSDQQKALANLHQAATQFEGVFLQMLMSAMDETVPKDSIFGQESSSEDTWEGMLSQERSQAMAQSGTFGLAQQLEEQLRGQVLGNASHEANAQVDRGNQL